MRRNFTWTVISLITLLVMGGPVLAESWFRWRDSSGVVHLTRDRPIGGLIFQELKIPDPIPWRGAPEMPNEIASTSPLPVEDLFQTSSRSVYWVAVRGSGLNNQGKSVYGSAVAITEDFAITNCHMLLGEGWEAIIGSDDLAKTGDVELIAADFAADRCVIRSRGLPLRPVDGIRRFDSLRIGEPVYAIGNPHRLERTISDGLLSGKRVRGEHRLIQISAPVSSGSSGGGLFDNRGNLIGITTSSRKKAQNINFAIPAADFWN